MTSEAAQKPGQRLSEFNVIHTLMARGAYISAAGMLEDLYAQRPDDRNVTNLLLTCYIELKAYEKAEILLKRVLRKNPYDYQFRFQILELYLKSGRDSLITKEIDNILASFPGDKNVYTQLIDVLTRDGYPYPGIDLINRARTEFSDSSLFALKAASVYEIRGEYFEAVMEYFRAVGGDLAGDSTALMEADRRLAALIRYPQAPPEVIRGLKAILAREPGNLFALKNLSEAYIKQGDYGEAFDVVVSIDSIAEMEGKELYGYLRKCHERKLYRQVIQAADYIERTYPDNSLLMSFKFFRAAAYRGLGEYLRALEDFNYVIEHSPNHRDQADALLSIGNIYRYDLIKYDSALIFYDSVLTHYRRYVQTATRADIEKAQMFMVQGELDRAEKTFLSIDSNRIHDDWREAIDFNLAMIEFYRKNFESADLKFRQHIQRYPRGFYLNDALLNSLIIGESVYMAPEALAEYSEALLFDFRLMPDSVESRLQLIIDRGESPLLGMAHYRLAGHYAGQNRETEALEIIDSFGSSYPDDYYLPYCLKLKADILSRHDENKEDAIEIYRSILTDYGDYPFTGEIRQQLQELENYRPAG